MSDLINKLGQEEEPVIVIERDDDEALELNAQKTAGEQQRRRTWLRWLLAALGVLVLMAGTIVAYKLWAYYYRIGVNLSTTPRENIQRLKAPVRDEAAEVVLTSDSILGVALDFYALHGLTASVQFEEPDTADASVYL